MQSPTVDARPGRPPSLMEPRPLCCAAGSAWRHGQPRPIRRRHRPARTQLPNVVQVQVGSCQHMQRRPCAGRHGQQPALAVVGHGLVIVDAERLDAPVTEATRVRGMPPRWLQRCRRWVSAARRKRRMSAYVLAARNQRPTRTPSGHTARAMLLHLRRSCAVFGQVINVHLAPPMKVGGCLMEGPLTGGGGCQQGRSVMRRGLRCDFHVMIDNM